MSLSSEEAEIAIKEKQIQIIQKDKKGKKKNVGFIHVKAPEHKTHTYLVQSKPIRTWHQTSTTGLETEGKRSAEPVVEGSHDSVWAKTGPAGPAGPSIGSEASSSWSNRERG